MKGQIERDGQDVNAREDNGESPLAAAAAAGDLKM